MGTGAGKDRSERKGEDMRSGNDAYATINIRGNSHKTPNHGSPLQSREECYQLLLSLASVGLEESGREEELERCIIFLPDWHKSSLRVCLRDCRGDSFYSTTLVAEIFS